MYREIRVSGMTCQHCVKTVKNALIEIDGIEDVIIDLESGIVKIEGDIDIKKVEDSIRGVGYAVE